MTKKLKGTEKTEYVLLPMRGTHSPDMAKLGVSTPSFSRTLQARLKASSAGGTASPIPARQNVEIVHSASPTGAKLASATPQGLAALRVEEPGVRAVPIVVYDVLRSPRLTATKRAKTSKTTKAATIKPLRVKVVDPSGLPIKGALVVALTDFEAQVGDDGTSNAGGEVRLRLQDGPKVEVLAVYADITGHWGLVQRKVSGG